MNECVMLMYAPGLRGRSMHAASLPTSPVITGHYCSFRLFVLLGALITTWVPRSSLKMLNNTNSLVAAHTLNSEDIRETGAGCVSPSNFFPLLPTTELTPLRSAKCILLMVLFMLRSEKREYGAGGKRLVSSDLWPWCLEQPCHTFPPHLVL